MAYEQKPGDFTLFRNEKKQEGDKRPDYNGSGIDLSGQDCWISAWVKRSEGKKPFFSVRIEAKEAKAAPIAVKAEVIGDDLPF
jgi:uncharacterized protein (DUF736 family)